MSFGYSIGDINTISQLCWNVYRACKGAAGEYEEIGRELITLHVSLKNLEEEAASPISILNRRGAGQKDDMDMILNNIKDVLGELERTVSNLSAGSLAKIEIALEELIIEIKAGKRAPTVLSVQDEGTESVDAWKELEMDLLDSGITKKDIEKHKDTIRNYIKILMVQESENADFSPKGSRSSSVAHFMAGIEDSNDVGNCDSISQRGSTEQNPRKDDITTVAVTRKSGNASLEEPLVSTAGVIPGAGSSVKTHDASSPAMPLGKQIAATSRQMPYQHFDRFEKSQAIGRYDYQKAEDNDNEIDLVAGETISDFDLLDPHWYAGSNSKGEHGFFPANYVELLKEEEPAQTQPASHVEAATTLSVKAKPTATAAYDNEAPEYNELSFATGDMITDVEFPYDDWWWGHCNEKPGYFPPNSVQLVDE